LRSLLLFSSRYDQGSPFVACLPTNASPISLHLFFFPIFGRGAGFCRCLYLLFGLSWPVLVNPSFVFFLINQSEAFLEHWFRHGALFPFPPATFPIWYFPRRRGPRPGLIFFSTPSPYLFLWPLCNRFLIAWPFFF